MRPRTWRMGFLERAAAAMAPMAPPMRIMQGAPTTRRLRRAGRTCVGVFVCGWVGGWLDGVLIMWSVV